MPRRGSKQNATKAFRAPKRELLFRREAEPFPAQAFVASTSRQGTLAASVLAPWYWVAA
jgi:hypothetical protein